jgi:Ca-activated chloride channel family protein
MNVVVVVIITTISCSRGCKKKTETQIVSPPSKWQWPSSVSPMPSAAASRNMVIVFDASNSMDETLNGVKKIVQANRATKLYVNALPPDVNIGLVAFDATGTRRRADIGTDRVTYCKIVDSIALGNGTPLGEAVEMAYTMLAEYASHQPAGSEYHLVVVTDGGADDKELLTKNVTRIVEDTPIQVFTIGFGIGNDHVLNKPGPQIRYVSADNEAEIGKGLEKVLAEAEPVPTKK